MISPDPDSPATAGRPGIPARTRRARIALGGWWARHRAELAKDALVSAAVGAALVVGAAFWDSKLDRRQQELTVALARQAEVLENTRFVREVAITPSLAVRPFSDLSFNGAPLSGLPLGCIETDGRRVCSNFARSDFTCAALSFTDLTGADLTGATLRSADLTRAKLTGASLNNANLENGQLSGADLSRANFSGANLSHAFLEVAQLTGTNLTAAKLIGADLTDADLSGAFLEANLTEAVLTGADLTGASLVGAILTNADLRDADLTGANLTGATLTDICFNEGTMWGTNTPPSSPACPS